MGRPDFSNSAGAADAAGGIGHWASHALIASIVAAIGLRLRPIDPANPLALYLPLLVMLVVVVSWLQMRSHDRRLCERCMSAIPLNPSESAARYRRRLALVHLASNRPIVIGYVAVLIGSVLIPGTIGVWIWALVQTSMIYLVLSSATHRRLQPWCPVCRGDGGGTEDPARPDPVPLGSSSA